MKQQTAAKLCSFIKLNKNSQSKKMPSNPQNHTNVNKATSQLANEAQVLKILQQLAQQFCDYHLLHTSEQKTQRTLVDKLLELSHRYLILMCGPEADFLSAICTIEPSELLIVDFNKLHQQILSSNKVLKDAAYALQENYTTFKHLQNKLDFRQLTPFVVGDAEHKPLEYFIELVDDMYSFIYGGVLKLHYYVETLEPGQVQQLETYKQLLTLNEDFEEQLLIGSAYCKCLKTSEKAAHNEQETIGLAPVKRCIKLLAPT